MYAVAMSSWSTIEGVALALGVSKRTVQRAVASDGVVELADGQLATVETRAPTADDLEALGLDGRTKRVARVVGREPPPPPADEPPKVRRAPEPKPADPDREQADAINDAVARALADPSKTEETIAWLEGIRDGDEVTTVFTSKGDKHENQPWPPHVRVSCGMHAEKLRWQLAERDQLYIPRDDVMDALVGLASLLASRLSAMPPRLADRLVGAETVQQMRDRLETAINEIRDELGDAAERQTMEVLGER